LAPGNAFRQDGRGEATPLRPLTVLCCDNHLLAVAKPAGVPIVPDESGDPSLLESAKEWVRREFAKPGEAFLGVVHRLDRPVSGVVVFAHTSKAARRLTEAFRERSVEKLYLGLSERPPREEQGELEQWLVKDRARNVVRACAPDVPGARRALSRFRLIGRRRGGFLCEWRPQTGRAHQLRVASATLGAPLLGDLKYGASAPLEDRSIGLHALRLELTHPTRGERLAFACPPPEPWPWRA
jgi:23S rRNA pseudouridine1911/1915/1917 synthase